MFGQPATTTRQIKRAGQAPIPANTDTTAYYSSGSEVMVVIKFEGVSLVVPTTAVRFL
jgi:hypothetical protein